MLILTVSLGSAFAEDALQFATEVAAQKHRPADTIA